MNYGPFDLPVDWQELDRLVDGQLSDDEYRKLISELELHQDGWRQCALAFLEHQALEQELSVIAPDMVAGSSRDDECLAGSCLDEQNVERNVHRHKSRLNSVWKSSSAAGQTIAWTSMAVSIAVGIVFGSLLHNDFQDTLRGRSITETSGVVKPFSANYAVMSDNDVWPELSTPAVVMTKKPNSVRASSPNFNQRIHNFLEDCGGCYKNTNRSRNKKYRQRPPLDTKD